MNSILRSIRYYLFRAIQILVHFCSKDVPKPSTVLTATPSDLNIDDEYIWVFVSTIGELNAIQLLLDDILDKERLAPVLLTDRPHYCDAFKDLYPNAVVLFVGPEGDVEQFFPTLSPKMFLIAEIPCFLSDGPCRFSYRVLYQLKRISVPIVLVNGWLYGEKPGCRIDAIEFQLLNQDYIQAIDLYLVQTETVKSELVKRGAIDQKTHVTGNCKFDHLDSLTKMPRVPAELAAIIDHLSKAKRPILVAGCVTNYKEQECILDAVAIALKDVDDLLLIFAPRYPEKQDRMEILYEMLTTRGLQHMKRTEFNRENLPGVSTLVLDSIGELKYLYQLSCISFVGRNHNVLEPMAFGNRVVVTPGWNKTYPSFPVYEETKKANLISESDDPITIARQIVQTANATDKSTFIRKRNQDLESLGGAVSKDLDLIRKMLSS